MGDVSCQNKIKLNKDELSCVMYFVALIFSLFSDVDLQRHLPDIADVIGWKDMQEIAMRSCIPSATIDSFKLSHPSDSQEQTLQLLRSWTERQGEGAGKKLFEILQNSGKRLKAKKVREILSRPA